MPTRRRVSMSEMYGIGRELTVFGMCMDALARCLAYTRILYVGFA
jgi:hypothetical protein